jgi:hypothetical protein
MVGGRRRDVPRTLCTSGRLNFRVTGKLQLVTLHPRFSKIATSDRTGSVCAKNHGSRIMTEAI